MHAASHTWRLLGPPGAKGRYAMLPTLPSPCGSPPRRGQSGQSGHPASWEPLHHRRLRPLGTSAMRCGPNCSAASYLALCTCVLKSPILFSLHWSPATSDETSSHTPPVISAVPLSARSVLDSLEARQWPYVDAFLLWQPYACLYIHGSSSWKMPAGLLAV